MIKLKDLHIGYNRQDIKLPGITGCFENGSITAVLGANGIGKSTFLKTLAGFLPPISGELKFDFPECPRISYLPQRINVNYKFPLSVFDVVAMGCWPDIGFFKKIDKEKRIIIWKSLECVKLENMLEKNISLLSVGQFQRMLFARLLVQESSVILLDEPFNSVDHETCSLMLSIINNLHHKGSTIILVIHDRKIVEKQYFTNILLLDHFMNVWSKFNR